MSVDSFRGYSPKEVAEMTGLFGEHELRRMARAGEVAHHRGGRNKIVFFPEDIKALKEALDAPDGSYRDRRRVETELAKRRWGMQRYLFDSAQLTPSRKRRKGNE